MHSDTNVHNIIKHMYIMRHVCYVLFVLVIHQL